MAEKIEGRRSLRNLLNKLKENKGLIRLIVSCLLLLIVCIFIGLFHIRKIYTTFRQTSYDYIFDRAQITANNFTNDYERKGSYVQSEAVVLSERSKISKESICNCLSALEKSGEFNYARYISENSIEYSSSGNVKLTSAADYDKYIESYDKVYSFKNFNPAMYDDEICFASAVAKNGIIQGYVIGVVRASDLFKNFDNNSATSVAERYLVDENGQILVYTKGNNMYDGAGKNIYDILTRDCLDDYDVEITKEEIENQLVVNDMASRQISIHGREGYALFEETNDTSKWAIFYIVYQDSVRALIRPVLIQTGASLIVIIVVMLIMAGLIMNYLSDEQKKMFELAYVDDLTKAPNENAFKDRAARILKENPDISYELQCFDIVNFRYINEGYGHEKADILLRALSEAIRESFSYNETYGRLGADRFVALCVDDGRAEERKKFIDEKLKETTEAISMKYPIRIKTGLFYVRSRKESVADMIDKANLARKSISNDGRVLVAEYREQLMESTRKQENIESRMEAALENHEFVPFLQPKWDMEKDKICGAEALVRWRNPDGSLVPPGEFIPLFERNGFIEKIDFYMLEEICKYIRRMIDENREVYPVSINQSRYLMYDPNYISRVQEILLKYKVPKGLVELELTETVFFHEKDRMLSVMRKLKEFNMELSIDDFGSGYSSLNLLRDIPFDVLKIDREFLDESSQSESGKWILKKIVEMAEGLKLRVICEGVETREQVEMLMGIGCKYAQGFLYSRPIPLEEYIEKYDYIKNV